jgi:4-hydroxymandelate oxidase
MDQALTRYDYEKQARMQLEPTAFDYFAGGALDERTLAANEAGFARVSLYQRVLRAATAPELSTSILGLPLSMPVLVAPVALQGMAHPDGEVATAAAAADAGIGMILSTTANRSFADVSAAARGAWWMQLYMMKDRGVTAALVQRAEAAGCKAIAMTADVPAWGRRERDIRNRFGVPAGLRIESLIIPGWEDFYDGHFRADLATFLRERLEFDLGWDDVAWLRSLTKLPIVLKGIGHPEDARTAVEHGVDAVYVSNHGGRQLDVAPATISVLPAIAEAVAGRCPIIVDGGVRRGTDVVAALASGANVVGVGRLALWALAVNGREGVRSALETLRAEIANTMTLCGVGSLSEISASMLADCAGRR